MSKKALPGNSVDQPYLIRSYEHEIGSKVCWWRPNELGYTTNIEEAGLYSKAKADEIVAGANYGGERNEKAVLISQAWLERPLSSQEDKSDA